MKMIVIGLAVVGLSVAAPAVADYLDRPDDDAVGAVLRGYGFSPLTPPSTLMSIGSLYYVDPNLRDFRAICHAEKADIEGVVVRGRSFEIQETLERKGQLTTGVKIDLGWMFNGDADRRYVAKVQSSLTDVVLEEIPLGPTWTVFAKLMKKPECNEMAMKYLHAGGYVCQVQRMLRATAEFKLDTDTQNKLKTHASAASSDLKDIVKLAVEAQGEQDVVAKEGRVLAGRELTYGATMTPLCLAPVDARFDRVLPQSAFGRFKNYVLFNFIEPIMPGKTGPVAVAHATDEPAQPD
jgi:hypothetical protein